MRAAKFLLGLLLVLASIAAILWVNFQIIGGWFGKNGPADVGSIEVSYVSMARFIVDFGSPFTGSSWNPLWYFGFPTHLFYTPLLPFLEVFLHLLNGTPLWAAYRFVTGLGFILAPVSLFFLGWLLSRRVIGGAIAGMLFSVSPTIFYWLNSGVAGDKFSSDFWDPRRFTILVRWGEGPHILSLVFVPLVGVCFARYLETKKFYWLLLAAICLGLAGLTNAIGLFASILIIVVMSFVKYAQQPASRNTTMRAGFFTGVLAFGLISFWYNLSFILNFFAEGGGTGKMLVELFPWGWIAGIFAIIFVYFIFNKVIRHFGLAVSLLWFAIFFTVVYVYYSTETIELLPQALRYNVEVDMSLSLLLGVGFAGIVDLLAKRARVLGYAVQGIGFLCILGFVGYIQPFIPTAYKAASNVVDIKKTGEYEIATWLDAHVETQIGTRVFVPGNYGFYLNYFTNLWQHRGALFQAAIHSWPEHMHYQMATGKNAEIAHAWLVIANAKFVVVSAREMYHEIKYPERFRNYEVVYDQNGDIIYEVPLKRSSVAKPVNLAQLARLTTPEKGDDKKALLAYADWVENSSVKTTHFTIVNNDTYKIEGTVGEGEGILVQMAADSGWRAKDNLTGKGINIKTDPMDFMVLTPQVPLSGIGDGPVDITLTHGKSLDEWVGYLVSLGTVVFVVWYGVVGRKYLHFSKVINSKKEVEKKRDN